MNRRPKGDGNLRLRSDGRWEARIGFDGKSKSIIHKDKRVVQERLTKLRYDMQRGANVQTDERQTLEQYMTTWLATKKATLEPTTYKRYEEVLRLYVYPLIGHTLLTKVTPQQVQRVYAHAIELGRAPNTVNKI